MFNFLKVKPVPKMFNRLQNLYKYFKSVNFNSDRLREFERGEDHVKFEFNTNLGPVQIEFLAKYYIGSNEIASYHFDYCNYAGFRFEITASIDEITVHPLMTEHLNANTIDLALLELEEHLNECFGDADFCFTQMLLQIQQEQEFHELELQKLY